MSIFLCYSDEDETVVGVLARGLEVVGRSVSPAQESGGSARTWRALLATIRASSVFVFALSEASSASRSCRAQLSYAEALGLPVVRVQVGRVHGSSDRPDEVPITRYDPKDSRSAFDVLAAVEDAVARARPLPGPLPVEPDEPLDDVDHPEQGGMPEASAGGVFICYRREEAGHAAGRIADSLKAKFGAGQVFMDVDSIEPGMDFAEAIESAVDRCTVVLALIGRRWTTLVDDGGRRKLDDPDDYVVLELRTACERGVPVIPVLLDGADMPLRHELPDVLSPLARRQSTALSHKSFHVDLEFLSRRLLRLVEAAPVSTTAAPDVPDAPRRYRQAVSRVHPGCLVVLMNRSAAMGRARDAWSLTLSEIATRMTNSLLLELCIKGRKQVGRPVLPYFDVGVFGYGERTTSTGQGIESLLPGALGEAGLMSLSELAEQPLATAYPPVHGGVGGKVPVWINAAHGQQAPLCESIAVVGGHVFDWTTEHPRSAPPVVINLTCDLGDDSPYEGTDLEQWNARLGTIATESGSTLVFHVLLTVTPERSASFADDPGPLTPVGRALYRMSSVIPEPLIETAGSSGLAIRPGARGMFVDPWPGSWAKDIVRLFPIGTRISP